MKFEEIIKGIKKYLKNYGGYIVSPILLLLLISFWQATSRRCKINVYHCLFSDWIRYIILSRRNGWLFFAIISGLLGAYYFDRNFKPVKSRIVNQILGFFAFFWIIPALVFFIGALLGVMWIW